MKKFEWLIWLCVALLALSPMGFYLYIFIPASNHSISDNHAAWASFGSFLGGTIGPLVSGLAFWGVWKTYKAQAEQLKISREQLESSQKQTILSEFQSIISNTANDIKKTFDSQPKRHSGPPISLFQLIGEINDSAKKGSPLADITEDNIEYELNLLESKISFLCHAFDFYKENGGNPSIIRLYRDFVGVEVWCLYERRKLNDVNVHCYFFQG